MEHTKGKIMAFVNDDGVEIRINGDLLSSAIMGQKKAKANACHICRCVNAHDGLMEALRQIIEEICAPVPIPRHEKLIFNIAEQALKEADSANASD